MSICTILVQVLCSIYQIPLETVVTGHIKPYKAGLVYGQDALCGEVRGCPPIAVTPGV